MKKMNRHEQRKTATREQLLHAAAQLVAEKGYDAVDVFDITEYANLARGTFYLHFTSKEACLHQVMLQGFDALAQRISADAHTTKSHAEWALNSYHRLFEWAENNRLILSIVLDETAPQRLNLFARSYMAEVIERQLHEISISRDKHGFSLPLAAQTVTGILIQFLSWWSKDHTGYSVDDMAHIVDNIMLSSFGSLDT